MGASAGGGRGRLHLGQVGRVPVGQVAVDHQHGQTGPVAGDLEGHGLEVEAAVDGGHDEQGGIALGGDEAHLAAAVDGDERVLPGPEPGQGPDQHQRLVPGGQLPAHTGAAGHPVVGEQAGGGPEAGVPVPGEGELLAGVLVGQHGVGGGRGPPLDQPPQGGRRHPAPGRGALGRAPR